MGDARLMIGGEAGQGVQSIGFMVCKLLARGGYHVYGDQDYESRVRGGHNFFRIRAAESEVGAIDEKLDLLLALNQESVELHRGELAEGGIIIFDQEKAPDLHGERLFGVPLGELAEKEAGNRIAANTVALGACLGVVGFDAAPAEAVLEDTFGSSALDANVRALKAGHAYARASFTGDCNVSLRDRGRLQHLLVNGNEALTLGAIAAGCNFISAYPMTPASSIMEFMAARAEDLDLVVVQAEDEIAAVNMAVGAGYAGIRAMTATSGSGLCLMAEGLGLAGLTETPVVIVDAQRPGPAVGMPTRTEQGDLQFVLYTHHGDFPRAVLAPSTIDDAFYVAARAFNLADRYQIPVLVLTDHLLATSYQTVPPFDLRGVDIDRGEVYVRGKHGEPADYKRHRVTESGISPRAFPGLTEALVVTDSDEHDESGHMTESAEVRCEQVDKRLRKLNGLRQEAEAPRTHGAVDAETLLVSWGSTYGAVREAADILGDDGMSVGVLHLSQLWPFPSRPVAEALQRAGASYVVEGNATGQLARLIRTETGIAVDGKILKYDGRPFTPAYIAGRVRKGETAPW